MVCNMYLAYFNSKGDRMEIKEMVKPETSRVERWGRDVDFGMQRAIYFTICDEYVDAFISVKHGNEVMRWWEGDVTLRQ